MQVEQEVKGYPGWKDNLDLWGASFGGGCGLMIGEALASWVTYSLFCISSSRMK